MGEPNDGALDPQLTALNARSSRCLDASGLRTCPFVNLLLDCDPC